MARARRHPCWLAGALALALPAPVLAQADDPHAACAAVGWVPREILQRPVPLREGIGRTHETVTTASPEAQAFHDQGMAYLHSYVWIEAARSFHQALRLDPKLALSWIGLSRVYTGLEDQKAARAALGEGQARAGAVSEKERRKIALRALQLDAIDELDSAARHAEYKRALDDALAADLDDVELWLLRGNAEERNAAGRGQRGGAASVAFYRQALAVWPDHFAAHHYLVHSYEGIGRIDDALAHGEAYARLAPAVPHARHMWAHDLRRVGRVDEAIAEFRRAYDLETAYYRAESLPPDVDWHRPHNLDLLATCYQHQGRNRLAEETMREREQVHAAFAGMEFNRKNWPGFLLSTGRAEQSLAAARELLAGRWESTWPIGHALAGEALLALGRLAEAEAELVRAQETLARLPATQTFGYVTRGSVEPHVDMLRGQVLLARGRREEAREVLQTVQRTLRSVPGPDAWTEALFRLEAIAEAARRAGDWELAAYTAEQMRDHDPAYAGTHYALGLVAEHAGDRARARTEFEEAVRLWARADTDLPALRAARARRDALAADASSTQRPPRSAESAETK